MSSSHISRARKAQISRPGALSYRASRVAKWTLIGFLSLCVAGSALMIIEISTPGMAWYVYE